LHTLDASHGAVTDAGVAALAHGCRELSELVLSGCARVSDTGVCAVAAQCGGHLRTLDLAGCGHPSDAAALALAAHCGQLAEVAFETRALTDMGFTTLCRGCPSLRHVSLKHCAVSSAAVERAEASNAELHVQRWVDCGRPRRSRRL
jgi:hypothetical protein